MSISLFRHRPSKPDPRFEVRFARTLEEFTAIVALREAVFRDEQHVVEESVTDDDDRRSVHAYVAIDGNLVSAGRLTPPSPARSDAQIAWVATLPGWRGRGAARDVVRTLLDYADRRRFPAVLLSAQAHAIPLYRSLGFRPYGERFDVRGIEHQNMERRRPLLG